MRTYILMDIEGTTTAIDFVHKTLFPYARTHMAAFLEDRGDDPGVRAALDDAASTLAQEGAPHTNADVRAALLRWIDEDRKHGALKKLQGMIWVRGYKEGHYQAHLYDDVKPAWDRWRADGKTLGIYSSGSVQAQKLLFGHTAAGDLNGMLSHYFDTGVGHKREAGSYRNIMAELGLPGDHILFLSDVAQELDAARDAGMGTCQLVRPGTEACNHHPTAANFDELDLSAL